MKKRKKSQNLPKKDDFYETHFDSAMKISIAFVLILFAIAFFAGCSEPKLVIKEVKVPTPCKVSKIPQEPKDINLDSADMGFIMNYIKQIIQYAKEVRPIMKECVSEIKTYEK